MKQTITSLTNETVKAWCALKKKKQRDQTGTFLMEGEHGVEEAIASGLCLAVWVNETTTVDFDGPMYASPQPILDKIASVASSVPVIALCKKPEKPIINHHRLLIVDKVQDPGNLGTIIRSALAFGFDGLYVSHDSVDVFNDKVVRSTQGAIFHLPIETVELVSTIEKLKHQAVHVVALSLGEKTVDELRPKENMAFVLGNESVGISDAVLDVVDERCMIPIQSIDSLNVAVAGSIIAYKYSQVGE